MAMTDTLCMDRIFFPDWHLNGISNSIRFPGWAAALREPGAELVSTNTLTPHPDPTPHDENASRLKRSPSQNPEP